MDKGNIFKKTQNPTSIKKKIWFLIFLIFIVLIFFAFFTGDRNIRHFLQLKVQIADLELDIQKLEIENQKLEKMITLINEDPYYIEKIAREDLKKAREDEIIIEFQDEEELEIDKKSDPNH